MERATRTVFASNVNLRADEKDVFMFFSQVCISNWVFFSGSRLPLCEVSILSREQLNAKAKERGPSKLPCCFPVRAGRYCTRRADDQGQEQEVQGESMRVT